MAVYESNQATSICCLQYTSVAAAEIPLFAYPLAATLLTAGVMAAPKVILALQQQIVDILNNLFDSTPLSTLGVAQWRVFDNIYSRPADLSDADFDR
jgi:hypothetical protein